MKSKVFGMSTLYAKEENHRKSFRGNTIDNPSLLAAQRAVQMQPMQPPLD